MRDVGQVFEAAYKMLKVFRVVILPPTRNEEHTGFFVPLPIKALTDLRKRLLKRAARN